MAKWWADHSLTVLLTVIFVAHLAAYLIVVHPQWEIDYPHAHMWPGFWRYAGSEWLVLIAAEPWGAILMVWLTKRHREKDSDQSG